MFAFIEEIRSHLNQKYHKHKDNAMSEFPNTPDDIAGQMQDGEPTPIDQVRRTSGRFVVTFMVETPPYAVPFDDESDARQFQGQHLSDFIAVANQPELPNHKAGRYVVEVLGDHIDEVMELIQARDFRGLGEYAEWAGIHLSVEGSEGVWYGFTRGEAWTDSYPIAPDRYQGKGDPVVFLTAGKPSGQEVPAENPQT
jgi:hypothetical protein